MYLCKDFFKKLLSNIFLFIGLFLLHLFLSIDRTYSSNFNINCKFKAINPVDLKYGFASDRDLMTQFGLKFKKIINNLEKKQTHKFDENKFIFSEKNTISNSLISTPTKIKWKYQYKKLLIEYTFFKSNNKINIRIKRPNTSRRHDFEGWGDCKVNGKILIKDNLHLRNKKLFTSKSKIMEKERINDFNKKTINKNLILKNSENSKIVVSSKDCYKKISYPIDMFGALENKTNKSIREIQKVFVFGKNKLQEKPHSMLFGLAYLEVMINQLCEDMHNVQGILTKKKLETVVNDIRKSMGISEFMERSKVINIYWSTGKLLTLANIKIINIDEERKQNINSVREIKSMLRTLIKEKLDENFKN